MKLIIKVNLISSYYQAIQYIKEGTIGRASFDRTNCKKKITWTTASDVSGMAAERHRYSTPGVGQEL